MSAAKIPPSRTGDAYRKTKERILHEETEGSKQHHGSAVGGREEEALLVRPAYTVVDEGAVMV